MLTARPLQLAVIALTLFSRAAQANGAPLTDSTRTLREPTRLTAGSSNELLGFLSADERALYFVSDRNASLELFVQDPVEAGPRLLFENNADASWPRLSPDQTRLAYISYREDAAGDICVLALDDKTEHCFADLSTAALQVLWLDAKHLAALVRPGLHGDYELRRLTVGDNSPGTVLLKRNMAGFIASPDGRWWAYVPIFRAESLVGVNFANRVGHGIQLQRNGSSAPPIDYKPDLPGVTGFPVFSSDGRYLYFSQYLNDTNRDGAIDGNDNSVLFRVPFAANDAQPIHGDRPQQLTSAKWNCQYPSPSRSRLVMTCSHEGSLDIYALPLDGAVPAPWDANRLRGELRASRNGAARLLLLARLLALVNVPAERLSVLRDMIALHLEQREYESALYYSDQLARLATERNPRAQAFASVLRELALHRREDVALIQGQLSERYLSSEAQRFDRLKSTQSTADPDLSALITLALSEIADDIGRKDESQTLFKLINPLNVRDPLVLALLARRCESLYRIRANRDALLSTFALLATHPQLSTHDRLRYADAFADHLTRGTREDAREVIIAAWIARFKDAPNTSELTLTLETESALLRLKGHSEEEVRSALFELYKKNKDFEKRRALALETVRTATRVGNEFLQYQFMTTWASFVRRSDPERPYAEALYDRVVLERAYTELHKRKVPSARADFFATTLFSDSLEAHTGLIEAWLREGRPNLEQFYQKRFLRDAQSPVYAFVRAYLLARGLSSMDSAALTRRIDQISKLLRLADGGLPRSIEVHQLWGYVMHQRYLRTGSNDDAAAAYSHYLLALDLARANPRFTAALNQEIGMLQVSLGNYPIAEDSFLARDRLPHVVAEKELSLRLGLARSLFHNGKAKQARLESQKALALLTRTRPLLQYRPLVIDRIAFYSQAAGEHAQARRSYEELIPIVDGARTTEIGALVNRVKARLGAASAAMSTALFAVAARRSAEAASLLASTEPLRKSAPKMRAHFPERHQFERTDFQLLSLGLTAQANRALGRLSEADRSMGQIEDVLAARFKRLDTDEDLLELARAEEQRGEYAFRMGQFDLARQHLESALQHSDQYNKRTGSDVNEVGLRLLRSYAALYVSGKLPTSVFKLNPALKARQAYAFVSKNRSPNWVADRLALETYLVLIALQQL